MALFYPIGIVIFANKTKNSIMKNILCLLLALFLSIVVQAQDFKFAVISDTHVMPKDEKAVEDLERCIEVINEADDIDFVLVLGDISGEGDKHSLEKAKNTLDKLNKKYYAVSGNHETKWSASGATAFTEVFGSERFEFEHNGFKFLGFASGPIIRMMDGHISPDDLEWVKNILDKDPSQKSIICTHYPLFPQDLDNWHQLTDVLRNYNVRAVLGGHYHSNKQVRYDDIPGFINRSSLRDKEGCTGFNIYYVTQQDIFVVEQNVCGDRIEDPKPWAMTSLKKQYFTKENNGYDRPDYSVNESYPFVKNDWSLRIGQTIYASPIVHKGKVYIGDDKGNFYCFDTKNGRELWRYKTGDRIIGTADADDKVVVVGSTDHKIYALDAKSGKLKWTYEAEAPVFGCTTILEDVVYIGSSDNTFRALNIKDGSLKWEYKGVGDYIESKPLIYQGKVIFGAWDTYLYALDQKTGQLLWKWQNPDKKGMLYSPAAVWPVGANDKVFITAPDRVMTAVDINTGETVWRTPESMVRETIGLSEDKKRVYSKTMQDNFVCYSATENEPLRLWITNVAYGYDHAASMPVEKGGVVFGSTKNGIIFTLDGKSGRLIWKHKVGNSLVGTVVPLDANSCIYTTSDGVVGLLNGNRK